MVDIYDDAPYVINYHQFRKRYQFVTARIAEILSRRQVLRTRDLTDAGVDPRHVAAAVRDGMLVRPVMKSKLGPIHGIYVTPEANVDPTRDDCIAMVLTGGVLCHQYAGMRHGITTSLRRTLDVLVPHGSSNVTPRANVELHRARNPAHLTLGVDVEDSGLGVDIRITSPARTAIDLLRRRAVSEDDYRHGLEALASYFENGGDIASIVALASHFEASFQSPFEALCIGLHEGNVRNFGA